MHELSIAHAIVTTVTAALPPDAERATEVRVRIGVLSGVVPDALQFAYEVAVDHTPLADTVLVIESVPVVVHCSDCAADTTLAGATGFVCGHCGQPCGDVRQGRDLEVAQVVFAEPVATGGSA